jgi:predicted nucleotidyltransferase
MNSVRRSGAQKEVVYGQRRWETLRQKRGVAMKIMNALWKLPSEIVVLGSVARGDVDENSDVDLAVLAQSPSYRIELALEKEEFTIHGRLIVQATPMSSPRAYIFLDPIERTVVSFPMTRMTRNEGEFHKFGGSVTSAGLAKENRVPGVDKRLMLIEPTSKGHRESSVLGRESEVAKVLSISVETVNERIRVLTRRDEVGRTGPVVRHRLSKGESFETALADISRQNPMLRKTLEERG